MKHNDILWKSILEEVFDDFLKFFFPNAEALFDLEQGFEYLDQELEQLFPTDTDDLTCKYVDKLVKVYCRSGAEAWLLVHIEVQGYRDEAFTDRMFTYYYRIWDKYRKPVTAFAILTDDCRHFLPGQFEQACLGTSLCFRFNSFKVLDQSEAELEASDNPFAQVVLAVKLAINRKRFSSSELYRLKIDLAKRLLKRNFSKRKVVKLMEFLKFYVPLEDETLDREYFNEVKRAINSEHIPMTWEETILYIEREEAKEERNVIFIRNLLRETQFNEEEIARLADVSIDFVRKIKQQL
ncbi:Putative transposase, YhgA-like [Dyadobacter soli]|uniref:Putative transposase, YhgA-like n=1 Tax=Dyadobacter soli TaxID=659014 RepID=A0A1G7RNN1_9BACT|nr:Rpn family recombination-promoting nuclease/putative transposase [Dyadobacter soli]SDG12361.1 Putative transposase, YhgA-like [Dyadobacter soli]